ncbi:hypothetical protein OSTOST_00639 [Ostertagia ostertagi]
MKSIAIWRGNLKSNRMVLPYEINPYGDAVVTTKALSRDVVKNRFTEEIIETYVRWKTERIKGVWVHISLQRRYKIAAETRVLRSSPHNLECIREVAGELQSRGFDDRSW